MENQPITNPTLQREELPPLVFRRPEPRDETDRIGREIVRRLVEAGVVEP